HRPRRFLDRLGMRVELERLSRRLRSARLCPGMSSGRNPMMSRPGGRSPPATSTQYYTQKRFRKGAHLVLRTGTRRAAAGLDNTMARLPLTGPVILAELGWMAMGIVDTLFVGRLGAEAIGAVSLGSAQGQRAL